MQTILSGHNIITQLPEILQQRHCRKFLLVCDACFDYLELKHFFASLEIPFVRFSEFTANPLYEQVAEGVALFNREECDALVAVGGGSAIDVAKCIKLFCRMNPDALYLDQPFVDVGVPLVAVPTTAGTGSESTRYAVIYHQGVKQSVTHDSLVPDCALLDASVLSTLPVYQKKCTMLDALCQAIESWWSVNSTDESKAFSQQAIQRILDHYKAYIFDNDPAAAVEIMLGSNLAGRAINITQTTAAHAMSYKLTSLFGIPHGHAVAIGLPVIFEYMIHHPDQCIDPRGTAYLQDVFQAIAVAFHQPSPQEMVAAFHALLAELEMTRPTIDEAQLEILTQSVNPTRLKNNPVALTESTIYNLYQTIGGCQK